MNDLYSITPILFLNSFYQEIQHENGYHLAGKQIEKHIFASRMLMIGRIAPISAWQCVINLLGQVFIFLAIRFIGL